MTRKSKGSFRGKTRTNAARRKSGKGFAYLSIPSGVEMFIPEADSKYMFDIMPYEVTDKSHPDKDETNEIAVAGSLWYKRPFKVHKQVGANNEKVLCLRSIGKPCPICDFRDELSKEEDKEEEVKALYASSRNLYAVMPIGDKKYDEKVYLFDFSDFLFQELFEEQLGDQDEFEIFPDHEEGVSLKVRFAEASFGKIKFAKPTRFDFEARDQQYDDSVLEEVPELDKCFNELSYDEMKAKFFEIAIDDEEEAEEEEKPKRTVRTSTRRKPKVEPTEKEEPEQEEEASTPRKRTSRRAEAKKAEETTEQACPTNHTFGVDNDEFDDCDTCDLWNACYKKQQGK